MKHERITVDPRVMVGKPCIKGTRIPVEHILRKLAARMTVADIINSYPRLTPDDVYAAVAYAADVVANEEIILSAPGYALSS